MQGGKEGCKRAEHVNKAMLVIATRICKLRDVIKIYPCIDTCIYITTFVVIILNQLFRISNVMPFGIHSQICHDSFDNIPVNKRVIVIKLLVE